MALSLGTSGFNSTTTVGTTAAVTITTTGTSGVLVACGTFNDSGAVNNPTITVGGSSLGDFGTARGYFQDPTRNGFIVFEFTKAFTSKLTSETLTLTLTQSGDGFSYAVFLVFEINGSPTSGYFDPNLATPVTGTPNPLSITTTGGAAFVYNICRFDNTTAPTVGTIGGTTATLIPSGANFFGCEYRITTANLTSASCTWTTGAGDTGGTILDAITAGAAPPEGSGTTIFRIKPQRWL